MAEQRSVFHILPVGWDHPGWVGGFYPEDLPREWRLSYFSNEFPGVMISQQVWCVNDEDKLNAWHDDVGERFRFYLALNQPLDVQHCMQAIRCLTGNFGGFVVDVSVWDDFSLRTDLKALGANCYLLFSKGMTVCNTDHRLLEQSRIALLLSTDDLLDLGSQRRFLEQLAGQIVPTSEIMVFLDGDPPAIHKLREFITLAQLLGLA
jgi:hypothetical protein